MTNFSAPTDLAEPGSILLNRARRKVYWHLLPLLFTCYAIAYVDRSNVALAKLTMTRDLPGFDNAVIGFGAGVFFWGYFLLEIPGSILVERWSARVWISRIMITWGLMAALTAVVRTPNQFYLVRFCLGLAEAGFFPGVIVYLTHWFPLRDRARALALFFIAAPVVQIVSPKISNALLALGTTELVNGVAVHHASWFDLRGWQWVYIFWGAPAVVLGFMVWFNLKDRPRDARWLTPEERDVLERELAAEKALRAGSRMTLGQALRHPKVLLLSFAYFCSLTGTQGLEFFIPSILQQWYHLNINAITWLVILPPLVALAAQLSVGWNSDRVKERRWHAVAPLALTAIALAIAPQTAGHLALTVLCFMVAFGGLRAYMPAFWALPSLFLTDTAAAGSIGLINSVGNLGGFFGPAVLGQVETITGSFVGGIYYLSASVAVAAATLWLLGLGRAARPSTETAALRREGENETCAK